MSYTVYLPADPMQETLLNLLLRNYLHYNLYDQAEKLRSKAPRFEAHSNQQVWGFVSCGAECNLHLLNLVWGFFCNNVLVLNLLNDSEIYIFS